VDQLNTFGAQVERDPKEITTRRQGKQEDAAEIAKRGQELNEYARHTNEYAQKIARMEGIIAYPRLYNGRLQDELNDRDGLAGGYCRTCERVGQEETGGE